MSSNKKLPTYCKYGCSENNKYICYNKVQEIIADLESDTILNLPLTLVSVILICQ